MIHRDGPAGHVIREIRMDSRRRRLWLLAVVAVVLAGATFVWWGNPRLGEGSLTGPGDGMSWANDGVEDTRIVVRGGSAQLCSRGVKAGWALEAEIAGSFPARAETPLIRR
jgi:hypothetical protein